MSRKKSSNRTVPHLLRGKHEPKELRRRVSKFAEEFRSGLPLEQEEWERIVTECRNEDANPLPTLILDVAELIEAFGFSVPTDPLERTPVEIHFANLARALRRDVIMSASVPDAQTVAEIAKAMPSILEMAADSQTCLWSAYRSFMGANEARASGDHEDALRRSVIGAGQLVRGVTSALAEIRSKGASKSAKVSHAGHIANAQAAREWYAKHPNLSKNAAAERMVRERVVAASFRTIRGYLTGQ